MSSPRRLETAARGLVSEPRTSVARPLGYANRLLLRVDHPDGYDPDPILHAIDPMARALPDAPANTAQWVTVKEADSA